jgi:hypothetical protein
MAVIIPTDFSGEARYTFECDLDDATFQWAFEWVDRDDAWYLSLADVDGNPLVTGRKVVLGYPLLNLYADARLPKGALYAVDTGGTDTEPGLLDLGDRVKLLYFSEGEL